MRAARLSPAKHFGRGSLRHLFRMPLVAFLPKATVLSARTWANFAGFCTAKHHAITMRAHEIVTTRPSFDLVQKKSSCVPRTILLSFVVCVRHWPPNHPASNIFAELALGSRPMTSLCSSCFLPSTHGRPCAACSSVTAAHPTHALPLGFRLAERYRVGKVLGSGGFGITYLAHDPVLSARVAIKEYFPRQLAGRDAEHALKVVPYSGAEREPFATGLRDFLEEARALEKVRHENVVRVRDFFEANGTAFMVMDFYDGASLSQHLAAVGDSLPEAETRALANQVLAGLEAVHAKGYLHRDLKPGNLYLVGAGGSAGPTVVILDFGAAREMLGKETRQFDLVFTDGYAPIEQYAGTGLGPWTDIYGLAATLYRCVTGRAPPPATSRREREALEPPRRLRPLLSPEFNAAVMAGLRLHAADRPRSVAEFRSLLAHGDHTERMQVRTGLPKDGVAAAIANGHAGDSPSTALKSSGSGRKSMPSTTGPLGRSNTMRNVAITTAVTTLVTLAVTSLWPRLLDLPAQVFSPSLRCELATEPPVTMLRKETHFYSFDVDLELFFPRTLKSTPHSLDEACETLKEIHLSYPGRVQSHQIKGAGLGRLEMSVIVYEPDR